MTRSHAKRFSIFWLQISILSRVHPSKFKLCSIDLYMHFLSRLVNKPVHMLCCLFCTDTA